MRILALWVVCGTCLTVPSHGDSVTQTVSSEVKTEGEEVTFSCSYDTTERDYFLYWYRQRSDSRLEFILRKGSSGSEDNADFAQTRFTGHLQKERKFTSLTISWLQLSDSAVYYCAFRRTVITLLISLNTLDSVVKICCNFIYTFTDDTTVVGRTANNDETVPVKEMESLVASCQDNNLCLTGRKKKLIDITPVCISAAVVKIVQSFKLLGGSIAINFSRCSHVNALDKVTYRRL
ncbi:T cell receptor alpha chain MC.7.G5-like [Pristis pectinata]|uniref:T cell receptor alpha chain MC.7.G5-like n=1 Tax=Pristis pectinata TaxID=685728 RepID=UPI00223CAF6D|nr:T cell receptor alpha chain MC.7.G5-like [Pristis pectinata]